MEQLFGVAALAHRGLPPCRGSVREVPLAFPAPHPHAFGLWASLRYLVQVDRLRTVFALAHGGHVDVEQHDTGRHSAAAAWEETAATDPGWNMVVRHLVCLCGNVSGSSCPSSLSKRMFYGKGKNKGGACRFGGSRLSGLQCRAALKNQSRSFCVKSEYISAERHTPTLSPFLTTQSLARQNW